MRIVVNVFSLVLFFILIGVPANPAFAIGQCDSYADTAVLQQRKNVENSCGFSGLLWHSNRGAHKSFCDLVGYDNAVSGNQDRDRMLRTCTANNQGQAVPEPNQGNNAQAERQCMRTDISEGQGASRREANDAAMDGLGRQIAQLRRDGYSRCTFNRLSCSGRNGNYTCWMDANCCTRAN